METRNNIAIRQFGKITLVWEAGETVARVRREMNGDYTVLDAPPPADEREALAWRLAGVLALRIAKLGYKGAAQLLDAAGAAGFLGEAGVAGDLLSIVTDEVLDDILQNEGVGIYGAMMIFGERNLAQLDRDLAALRPGDVLEVPWPEDEAAMTVALLNGADRTVSN